MHVVFYDDPELYFGNPAICSLIINRLGPAAVEYRKRHDWVWPS